MNCRTIKIIKGVISSLIVLLFVSCGADEEVSPDVVANNQITADQTADDPPSGEAVNYLALGDSYTIGQGVEALERWPIQLKGALDKANYNIEVVDIIAQTGWTTKNLLKATENINPEDYNLVSLLIGVNNQFQNLPFITFKKEFDLLLNKSIEIAGDTNNVFVVSIPDYGVTSIGASNSIAIGQEIDSYNEYMSDQCSEKKVFFINITRISRELADSDGALAPDGLHPSGSQYLEWTNKIFPTVKEILDNSK
jgi:lysophospholipase L1-like esterase